MVKEAVDITPCPENGYHALESVQKRTITTRYRERELGERRRGWKPHSCKLRDCDKSVLKTRRK
jgi:hypothetical protein